MVFREFLTRLGGRRDRETHSEAVPPRPQSQPTPFRPIPPTDHHPRPDPAPKFKRGHNLPVPNADESKPVGLSSYTVDPTAAYENNPGHKPGRKSTLHASTRLAIDVLKESSDAFAPLKSVAGGLSAIIKHCDQTMANRESIESLIPRVEGLAKSLRPPAPKGEIKEIQRRQELIRKLENVLKELEPLAKRGKITRFLNNVKDAEMLTGLADDIRDAMMDYQTALQQDIYYKNHELIDKVDLSFLKDMQHTPGAGFLAGDRKGCLKGTRRDVLLQIEKWLIDGEDRRVFWLNGLAGTGKSTIAQTFAEFCFADGKLGASFFCSRDFEDRSNLRTIFPTLAFQLAHRYPLFREQLLRVLRANHDVERESLSSQLEKLIIRPLKETQIPTLIIIDALDECKDKEPASALLSVLSRFVHEIPEAKFFITGRPEPPIREGFRLKLLRPITDVLKLHDVKRSSVDDDIKLFLRTYLTDIRDTRSDCEFPEEWPTSYHIDILCKMAGGLFIYASTVVKFVASGHHIPTKRLELILHSQGAAHEGGIDLLYTQILELAFQGVDPGEEELYSHFKNVVGAVLLVFHPLSRKALSNLVRNCETSSQISTTLRFLHSLLDVPDREDQPIRVFHKSFPDFLTEQTRCKDGRFFVNPSVHHKDILFSCLDLMKKCLKKNICNLDDYAVLSEVEDLPARREVCIGGSLEYACRFWTRHLANVPSDGPSSKRVKEVVEEFLTKRLLYWIEVLSIVGHLGVAVYAINNIREWYTSAGISTCEQADDSERLILEYFDAIHDSPSHLYHSALPLSPSSSWVRRCYEMEVASEVRVPIGLPEQWDACSRTILLKRQPTAFAYGGGVLAVGFQSDVELLDPITGIRTSVLCGHKATICSLAFSLDGALLVSRSEDGSVKLWDVQTGGVIKTFDDYHVVLTDPIYESIFITPHLLDDSAAPSSPFSSTPSPRLSAASISPDGTTIALGTEEGEIHLWDVRTGERRVIKTGQNTEVAVISFSPTDPRRFLSSSRSGVIEQWDIDGHHIRTFHHHEEDRVNDLTYTLDGTRAVSCGGMVATVWDSESGVVVVELDAPEPTFLHRCCLSPDGRLVACVADTNIFVWDITISGARLVGRLGHSRAVTFITFSSSLISGSKDRSVKFWQTRSFLADSETTDRMAEPRGSTSIMSVNLFAKDHTVVSSDQSGMVKTWDLVTGFCKDSSWTPAQGERDTHLAGGSLVIIWCAEGEYHVWDVYNSQLLRKFPSTFTLLRDLTISRDGSEIFGWGTRSMETVSMERGRVTSWRELFVVALVGSSTGPKVSTLREFPDRPYLDFVDWPTAALGIEPRWIGDTVTKRLVFRLPERYMKSDVEIRWDGRYVLVWSRSGVMVITDLSSVYPQSGS